MSIYTYDQDDDFFIELRNWMQKNPITKEMKKKMREESHFVPPAFIPVLYGEENGFYGKKHKPEQVKKWSEMRLGEKNPNYRGKAFTPKTIEKLRVPKKSKENYRGTPGKITCINKKGEAIQITKELYNSQKTSSLPISEWEYVNTNSKEAKNRRQK